MAESGQNLRGNRLDSITNKLKLSVYEPKRIYLTIVMDRAEKILLKAPLQIIIHYNKLKIQNNFNPLLVICKDKF